MAQHPLRNFAHQKFQERRKIPRLEFQGRVELDLPAPSNARQAGVPLRATCLAASSTNLSEGGVCVRLQEAIEIRSPVRLRLFAPPGRRPFECAGRVTWVIQRMDLRDTPPFLYDIGVEFVDPPGRLRQFASRLGLALRPALDRPLSPQVSRQGVAANALQPAVIRGRTYVPVMREETASPNRWHLIVRVDGAPCFSQRFPSVRKALEEWKHFRRQVVDRRLAR